MSLGQPGPWVPGGHPGWTAPAPPPKKSKLPLITLIAISTVAVLAFVLLLGLLNRPAQVAAPPPPPPPPPPVSTPAAPPSPTAEESPELPDGPTSTERTEVLENNPLYAVDVPVTSCPDVTVMPTDLAELEAFAQPWISCLTEAWRPVLTGTNGTWTDTQLIVFETDSINTACGAGSDAFYCSADNTIYIGPSMVDMSAGLASTGLPVSYFYIITHEYHHHVQNVSGIIEAMYYEYQHDPLEGMRRLELQDQCWVSMAYRTAGLDMTPEDEAIWLEVLSRSTSPQHGDSTSTVRWGTVGLSAETMAPCSTWTAPSEHVT